VSDEPTVVGDDYKARLKAAADDVESKRTAWQLAQSQRDRIIGEAVDHGGLSQSLVAKLVAVSQPHITRILGRLSAAGDDAGAALA
jgi:hypothetical protein